MALRALKRIAAPFVVLVSVLALAMATIGTANSDPADPPTSGSGNQTADNLGWNTQVLGGNVVQPGDTVTYQSNIWENSKAGGFLNLGRYIEQMRQIPPAGFEYVSSHVTMDANITNEGDAGVKASCTGGGCKSAPLNAATGFKVIGGTVLTFTSTYKVPADYAAGDYNSGFLFTVATFGSGQGASASGAFVRVEAPAVVNIDTSTSLDSVGAVTAGDTKTLRATVNPADATGSVQFKVDGVDVAARLR